MCKNRCILLLQQCVFIFIDHLVILFDYLAVKFPIMQEVWSRYHRSVTRREQNHDLILMPWYVAFIRFYNYSIRILYYLNCSVARTAVLLPISLHTQRPFTSILSTWMHQQRQQRPHAIKATGELEEDPAEVSITAPNNRLPLQLCVCVRERACTSIDKSSVLPNNSTRMDSFCKGELVGGNRHS